MTQQEIFEAGQRDGRTVVEHMQAIATPDGIADALAIPITARGGELDGEDFIVIIVSRNEKESELVKMFRVAQTAWSNMDN